MDVEEDGEDQLAEHKTNEEVLKKVEENYKSLMDITRVRQKNWIIRPNICYVVWLFAKRRSQKAIQRRSQRDRLVYNICI